MSSTPIASTSMGPVIAKKLWQDWPGEQWFFADGRVMVARNNKGALASAALILALEVAFQVFSVPRLEPLSVRVAAWVTGGLMAAISLYYLGRTVFTDPGILPRLPISDAYRRNEYARTQEVRVNGHSVTVRYDDTYHFFRPPRSHHCRMTNVVVEKFDHFCPWVGNTIGRRNYPSFIMFLLSTSLTVVVTIGFCVLHVVQHAQRTHRTPQEQFFDDLGRVAASPVLLLLLTAIGFAVAGMLGFHLYLIGTGQTTYESIDGSERIYSEGLAKNCWSVWCAPVPPAYVDFTMTVEEAERQEPPEVIKLYNPPWTQQLLRPPPRPSDGGFGSRSAIGRHSATPGHSFHGSSRPGAPAPEAVQAAANGVNGVGSQGLEGRMYHVEAVGRRDSSGAAGAGAGYAYGLGSEQAGGHAAEAQAAERDVFGSGVKVSIAGSSNGAHEFGDRAVPPSGAPSAAAADAVRSAFVPDQVGSANGAANIV